MSEYKYSLNLLQQDVGSLAFQLENGCGNHGCVIKRPSGMAPNGGCRCTPRQIQTKLLNLACAIDSIETRGAYWNV